jgi:arginyl-tRNA synthetase
MAGLNPRDVAQNILDSLEKDALIARADIAGAGFINIDITHEALSKKINSLWDDPRLGVGKVLNPRRIIIDFGGPNVAKPMHVGHLRTAVIGESLKRIFRFMGDTVMGDAHFGDWGYQMGLLITALGDEMPDLAYFSEDPQHDYPSTSPVTLFDLERLYPLASAKAKADTEYRDRARRATKALQDGREGYRALWKHFVTVSREALIRDYNDLGVTFDWWYGESDADAYIAPMIEDLMAKNLLVADQGAMVIHVAKDDDTRALPPLLVISSEGSSMYGTTDLATIRQRQEQYNPDLVLYCVDKRQSDHFEQVFRASDLAGYIGHSALEHAANGTVNGVDGKPFKTREGGVLKLGDLIDQAVSKAQTRLMEAGLGADLDAEEFSDTAKKIAIAAIKFAELSNHRLTNYVFDLDRFMSFEGKTGPYLMYQAVRMKSILRKSKALGLCGAEITVSMPAEVELTLLLDRFDAALRDTYLKRAPNILADHIFRLAQAFSKFYAACPVLIGDDDAIKASRIRIVELVLRQLEKGLELMGLSAPQRM